MMTDIGLKRPDYMLMHAANSCALDTRRSIG